MHTVEKIGGTSMSDYAAVRDNIIYKGHRPSDLYNRIFVVSAYGGITDILLEGKKTGQPGIFALFASDSDGDWQALLDELKEKFHSLNDGFFADADTRERADRFIDERVDETRERLADLERLCQHGHFHLGAHLNTVREMLASLGEAHSAWNLAQLLRDEGIAARFVDLSGWRCEQHLDLDKRILAAFEGIDVTRELPIVTGYAHTSQGLMSTFDRGYSEMTFSRVAVLTGAAEAVIHKEFHLSSADPRLVGADNAVPIGRTNYDVADQLASLGMEAIHPRAAKGLRQRDIPLRVKNRAGPQRHPGDRGLRQRDPLRGNHRRAQEYLRHRVYRTQYDGADSPVRPGYSPGDRAPSGRGGQQGCDGQQYYPLPGRRSQAGQAHPRRY